MDDFSGKIEHRFIETNNIKLHVVVAGPEKGAVVILLHGFPEFWWGWRHQIPVLAEAGFRVIAPDQRGYNLSDKPKDIAAYNLDELAADVIGLIDHFGQDHVYLVGHDWGGAVAWWAATKFPDRFKRMTILNVPHHRVLGRFLRTSREQKRKSWYMYFFQTRWLPELALRAINHRSAVSVLQRSSLPNTFSQEDLTYYRQAWGQPGSWTGMINWYRAAFRGLTQRLPRGKIKVPTLLVWGKLDTALGHEMAQPSIDQCEEGRLVTIEDATHWVQHEKPERVNELIIDHLI